jgi:hypothetical protein
MMNSAALAMGKTAELIQAEIMWFLVGSVVGFMGYQIGSAADKTFRFRKYRGANIALNFLPYFSMPACAFISALCAAAISVVDIDLDTQFTVCVAVNIAMFLILFTAGSGWFEFGIKSK